MFIVRNKREKRCISRAFTGHLDPTISYEIVLFEERQNINTEHFGNSHIYLINKIEGTLVHFGYLKHFALLFAITN